MIRYAEDDPPAAQQRPRIYLVIERASGHHSSSEVGGEQVTPAMLDAAEDLLHTLTTGDRLLPKDLLDLVARAFNTTRAEAKERVLLALYGGKTALMWASSTEKPT